MKLNNPNKNIPLMGEDDVKGWVENIIQNTNYIDIQILYDYLRKEFEDEKLDMIHSRVNKMCDRCEIVYPENYELCIRCGKSDKLRSFKIHNNMKELEKNW